MRKYLTEDGERILRKQIYTATEELDRIGRIPPGTGLWRMQRRYIDGLEYLLDMEYEEE